MTYPFHKISSLHSKENSHSVYTPLHTAEIIKFMAWIFWDSLRRLVCENTAVVDLFAWVKTHFSNRVIDIPFLILWKIIDTVQCSPAGYFKDHLLTMAKQKIYKPKFIELALCWNPQNMYKKPNFRARRFQVTCEDLLVIQACILVCHKKDSNPLFPSNSCLHKRRFHP